MKFNALVIVTTHPSARNSEGLINAQMYKSLKNDTIVKSAFKLSLTS